MQSTDWKTRHTAAWIAPREGFEESIVGLTQAYFAYANAHKELYESLIGDDYVLGPQWAAVGAAIIGLLNGETGRLDCGTIDSMVRNTATDNGWTEEL